MCPSGLPLIVTPRGILTQLLVLLPSALTPHFPPPAPSPPPPPPNSNPCACIPPPAQFRLNGILADDMGLGKTLEALAIISADCAARRARRHLFPPAGMAAAAATSPTPAVAADGAEHVISSSSPSVPAHANLSHGTAGSTPSPPVPGPLPSLVVCPATVCQHWVAEIAKFCTLRAQPTEPSTGAPNGETASVVAAAATTKTKTETRREDGLAVVHYAGTPVERRALLKKVRGTRRRSGRGGRRRGRTKARSGFQWGSEGNRAQPNLLMPCPTFGAARLCGHRRRLIRRASPRRRCPPRGHAFQLLRP